MITKKLLSLALSFMFVLAGAMVVTSVVKLDGNIAFTDVEATNTTYRTAYQNVSAQIDALVPSFFLLAFVMVFMIMLLTIVDRFKK